MPTYELSVLIKAVDRPETVAVLKRIGTTLFNKGVVVKHVESLGTKNLPYRMMPNIPNQSQFGTYFLFKFDSAPHLTSKINRECSRDVDILRSGCVKIDPELNEECTLHEEFKPPALRESVQKLIEKGKKNKRSVKPKKEYNFFDIYM